MKSKKKNVKDSPSALAFSSLAKKRLLSDLDVARKNVKNKFKRAYLDRIKREHKMKEVFKPITSKIPTLSKPQPRPTLREFLTRVENNTPMRRVQTTPGMARVLQPIADNVSAGENEEAAASTTSTNRLRTTPRRRRTAAPFALRRLENSMGFTSANSPAQRLRNTARRNIERETHGEAIGFNFIPYNAKNHVVYEYFDDPNELCDRLRLLVSSKAAGNTNHMQEINSILEELRELGCIQ